MQAIARTIPACRCGKDGRLKQGWIDGRGAAIIGLLDSGCLGLGCQGSLPWQVFEDRPFETMAWREDLVACGCGAEGRLKQDWAIAHAVYCTQKREGKLPSWVGLSGTLNLLGTRCSSCRWRHWPVVPGALVEFPSPGWAMAPPDQGFVDTNLTWFLKMARAAEASGGLKLIDEVVLLRFLQEQDWPKGLRTNIIPASPVIRRRLFTGEEG